MSPASSTSIMVIGADSHFCYLMRRYIQKSAHSIVFAYLGENALDLAVREQPAAIILETDQPDSAGWHVLKDLQSNCSTSSIPVVVCSWQDEGKHGLEAGAKACLRKPILYDDFVNVLASIGIVVLP